MNAIIDPFSVYKVNNRIHVETRDYRNGADNLHFHDYYQCLVFIKGSCLHKQGNEKVLLSERDAFILPPYFPHEMLKVSKHLRFYSLSICEDFFSSSFSDSTEHKMLTALSQETVSTPMKKLRFHVSLDPLTFLSVSSLMECLMSELFLISSFGASISENIAASILMMFSRILFNAFGATKEYLLSNAQHNIISDCIHYIDLNYMKPIVIDELAKSCALSRSSFYSNFTDAVGISPRSYITRKRIEVAQRMISFTGLSISDISKIVGFTDFSTFYRNFIAICRCSPSQYRTLTMSEAVTGSPFQTV